MTTNIPFKYGPSEFDSHNVMHLRGRVRHKLETSDNPKKEVRRLLDWVHHYFLRGDDIRMDQEEAWVTLVEIDMFISKCTLTKESQNESIDN